MSLLDGQLVLEELTQWRYEGYAGLSDESVDSEDDGLDPDVQYARGYEAGIHKAENLLREAMKQDPLRVVAALSLKEKKAMSTGSK